VADNKGYERCGDRFLSEVKPKKVSFLYEPYFIRGQLNMVQANPGMMKSYFLSDLSGKVTTGGVILGQHLEKGMVWLQNGEDGYAETIRQRIDDCGGNSENIIFIDEDVEEFSFDNMDRVEEMFKEYRPVLAIFDPIQNYIGSKVDMNRANQVRPMLSKIRRLSTRYNVCTVLVAHLNKQSMCTDGISRSYGSIDFTACSRSVLTVGHIPEKYGYSKNCRVIYHSKCNLAACGPPVIYEITGDNCIRWIDYDDRISESEIFSGGSGFRASKGRPPTTAEKAKTFLEKYLSDGGKECKAVITEAEKHGIARSVLFEAKKEMGIISVKDEKATVWKLPEEATAL
jgi:hypothetical protein